MEILPVSVAQVFRTNKSGARVEPLDYLRRNIVSHRMEYIFSQQPKEAEKVLLAELIIVEQEVDKMISTFVQKRA
jgi:hypothetical protein